MAIPITVFFNSTEDEINKQGYYIPHSYRPVPLATSEFDPSGQRLVEKIRVQNPELKEPIRGILIHDPDFNPLTPGSIHEIFSCDDESERGSFASLLKDNYVRGVPLVKR